LDLPEPLGPTTQVMPGSKRRLVEEAKDLKPRSVRLFRYTRVDPPGRWPDRSGAGPLNSGTIPAGSPHIRYRPRLPANVP
jgi:hypothetical protein